MGRPKHAPDDMQRRQVEALAGYGVPEPEIAALIGVDPKTLRKYYRHELDHGHTKANAKVAENLFRKATGEGRESVTAAIFWLKARARWKEVSIHEHGGVPGNPITTIRRIIVAPPDRGRIGNDAGADARTSRGSTASGSADAEGPLVVVTGVPRADDGITSGSGGYA